MHVGETQTWERTFTEQDVRLFGQLSRDQGSQHVVPDEQGRIMVHGLLTATLPTKLGGDWNYIARDMYFEFVRPVFVGDTIHCEVTITSLETIDQTTNMGATISCRNQYNKIVLRGHTSGVIRLPLHYALIGLH